MKSGIDHKAVLSDVDNQFVDTIAENYVAKQVAAKGSGLFYWQSDSATDLDFVLQQQGMGVVGVEVKSGLNVRSRSPNVFPLKNTSPPIVSDFPCGTSVRRDRSGPCRYAALSL